MASQSRVQVGRCGRQHTNEGEGKKGTEVKEETEETEETDEGSG